MTRPRSRPYRPERCRKWRGWTLTYNRLESPVQLCADWWDDNLAWVALSFGKDGCDPAVSVSTPNFHPGPLLARFIEWLR